MGGSKKYGWEQVILHWSSAAVILWVLVSGFYVAYAPVSETVHAWVGWFNVSLTTVYIPIFALRWLMHVIKPRPSPVHQNGHGRRLAHAAHEALYLMTAVVLLSGVLMMDRPIDVFGWLTFPAPLSQVIWQQRWFGVHIASCVLLGALVALHLAAVCLHQLCGRRILQRMAL